MGNSYSKTAILKRLADKYSKIPQAAKKGYSLLTGKSSSDASSFKRGIAEMLKNKSERQRADQFKKMHMNPTERKKFEQMISGGKEVSKEALAKQARIEERKKKRMVKMGFASSQLTSRRRERNTVGDYTNLGISDKVGHSASAKSDKKISFDDSRGKNVKSLSENKKSSSVVSNIGRSSGPSSANGLNNNFKIR